MGNKPLDRKTQDVIFKVLDQLRRAHGDKALTGIRKYMTLFKEPDCRQKDIKRLDQELADLKKKG